MFDPGKSDPPSAVPRPGQYTAMISSTALDLPAHRAAAFEACLSAGVFPIGMEHLPARDATGVTVSLEMVDKADLYIGIYANRYGWIPDGSAVSITEMEFDRALTRQVDGHLRELLIFTAHADHPWKAADIEADATAQKKLAAFKSRATSGRGRAQFRSVEELQRLISEALRAFLARQPASRTAASEATTLTQPIPHNLPRLQPFFGREDELKKIAAALDPDDLTWGALIDGPGGMGKTSLAVRAAYDAPAAHFDAIHFVSLKSRELDDDGICDLSGFLISGLAELLNELARLLGRDDIPRASESERPRLVLDALRGTRALLVLDNLESLTRPERDTLFTFIKRLPTGCKAILTARGRIGNGAEELILEKLSQDAALATLAELATHNPTLAATSEAERIVLYTQTNGIPLLLRWTAGQLGRGHCLTFTDAITFLRSCPPGNDPLEFIFGDLVDGFTPEETRALCALTYFTQPAKVEHLATIAGLPEPVTDRALRALATRSLAVPNLESLTYTPIPLVADFLRKQKQLMVARAGDRLETLAWESIMNSRASLFDGYEGLQSVWPVISASLPRFLKGSVERLHEISVKLQHFLRHAGHWDEQLALSKAAEKAAAEDGNFCNAGLQAYNSGVFYVRRGQADEAHASADKATDYFHKGRAFAFHIGMALQLKGEAYQVEGKLSDARDHFEKALLVWQSCDAGTAFLFSGIYSLAHCCLKLGDIDKAEALYNEAGVLAMHKCDVEHMRLWESNRAQIAIYRQEWNVAEALSRTALSLHELGDDFEGIASNNHRLAQALARQGRAAEALPHARRAVEIFEKLRSPRLADARDLLAECEAGVSGA